MESAGRAGAAGFPGPCGVRFGADDLRPVRRVTAADLGGRPGAASIQVSRVYLPEHTKHTQLFDGPPKEAAAKLVEKCGGEIVELAFLVELGFLRGREKLEKYPVFSAITY